MDALHYDCEEQREAIIAKRKPRIRMNAWFFSNCEQIITYFGPKSKGNSCGYQYIHISRMHRLCQEHIERCAPEAHSKDDYAVRYVSFGNLLSGMLSGELFRLE